MPWFAVQYKPAQGDRALENLQNQGACCFFPKVMVERIRDGKRVKKLEPLFPGYLFIDIEQSDPLWAKLRSTRGVLRVVGFANRPAALPEPVIEHLRSSLAAVSEQGGIKEGQQIALQDGPFKGLEAIFQSYEGEARAVVLINFMQKQQRVQVPLSAIGHHE